MSLTTDNSIVADGGTFLFPDNENGTLATREWVQEQGYGEGGGGTTPGIDDVLAEEQALTTDKEIELNGFGLSITGGTKSSGNAGNINIVAPGSNGVNDAGNVIINGGLKADGAGSGGDIIITSGGATVNDPGSIFINGANATSQGKGGVVNLTGGNAIGTAESGGDVVVTGGNGGAAGQGGNLTFVAGTPGVGGTSGGVSFSAGSANETGDGGLVQFQAGLGGSTSGNGGGFRIVAGNAQAGDGNGGSVIINTGEKNGSGSFGKLFINYISGGDTQTMLEIDPNNQTIKFGWSAEFADNAAALGGGLTAGMIYRTGDVLKIVH